MRVVMFWRFEGKGLRKPDREKIFSYLDIVKTSLTTPPPLFSWSPTKKFCFKKKNENEKNSYCLNLRRKVFELGSTPYPLNLKKIMQKKRSQTIWIGLDPPPHPLDNVLIWAVFFVSFWLPLDMSWFKWLIILFCKIGINLYNNYSSEDYDY